VNKKLLKKRTILIGMFLAALLANATGSACADDGGIAYGGSPSLLGSHPSISMVREKVVMVVNDKTVDVTCDFVFANRGKACKVRMGFPDYGYEYDPDGRWGDVEPMTPKTFASFVSYVDGKRVKSRLIRAKELDKYWHAKTVSFAAGQTLHVRDVYTQDLGGGDATIGGKSGIVFQAMYILHTGASWHGNIGCCEVDVRFNTKRQSGPANLAVLKDVAVMGKDAKFKVPTDVGSTKPNMVVWTGPCKPTVSGRTLRFIRTNFKPTKKDDIELCFGYRITDQQFSEAMGYDKPDGKK
jgi:hypothetical protein